MHKLLWLVGLLGCTMQVWAGEASGHVSSIYVADGSDAVLFDLDSAIANSPRCNEAQRFSINLRKPGGMAAYMALLEAKREGYVIGVHGLNTCSNEWKSEDLQNITLK